MAQANIPTVDPRLVDMWECLTLMSYIQHAEKVPGQEPNTGHRSVQPQRTTWQETLHKICVLCDFDKAADKFIALGVEKESDGTRFWLASNGTVTGKTNAIVEWLKKILRLLEQAIRADKHRREKLTAEIWQTSVRLSSGKVHNYHRRLENIVTAAEQEQLAKQVVSDSDWSCLSQALHKMSSEVDHIRLCALAYDFTSTPAFKVLGAFVGAKTNAGSRLQHYIGRLGSWKRAAVFIVDHASEYAEAFYKAELSVLEAQPSTVTFTVETNMRDLISRQCPVLARNEPVLNAAVEQLETATSQISKYGGALQRPIEHAEAIIAQHFHVNKLEFVYHDRYIGTAKPSCYACALFLDLHPGKFAAHRSHGHAWLRWSPPRPERSNLESDQGTWDLICTMTETMRRDIDNCIHKRLYGTQQNFSLTTGITIALRS